MARLGRRQPFRPKYGLPTALSVPSTPPSGAITQTWIAAGLANAIQPAAALASQTWTASGAVTDASLSPGTISTVTISADGWYADIKILGVGAGGSYNMGLGANNDPWTGSPRITFRAVSLGFDNNGNPITVIRYIYGTMQIRQAYPNATSLHETVSGSDVTIRVALSDYIFAKDASGAGNSGTDVVVSTISGLYTKSGVPSAAVTNMAVTNNSTLAYPRVVGQFMRTDFDKLGASYTIGGMFFNWSGQQGRPVRCVKYTMTDQHSNSVSATVLAPTIDGTYGDANPVQEYLATVDTTGFTQNDIVTLDYIAYPWVGDVASCLSSSDSGATTVRPSPLYGPAKFVADHGGTYCQALAVVNTASGNDITGVISNVAATAKATPFATIGGAYIAMRLSNIAGTYTNGVSRSNCGGGTIYLDDNGGLAQGFAWLGGGTITVGTTPDCNLIIAPYPGVPRANVAIDSRSASGGHSLGLRLKFVGITVTAQSASGVIDPNSVSAYMVVDGCDINTPTPGQPTFYRIGVTDCVRNLETQFAQGYKEFGSINAAYRLVRGETLNTTVTRVPGKPYIFVGNLKTNTSSTLQIIDYTPLQVTPAPDNLVWAFNSISTANTGGTVFTIGATSHTHGCAFVQNFVENINGVNPIVLIAGDGSTPISPINNQIIWNNTLVGQRFNYGYNENGATLAATAYRILWSVLNNVFDNDNIKVDTFNGNSVTATQRSYIGTTCIVDVVGPLYQNYAVDDDIYLEGSNPATYNVDGPNSSAKILSSSGGGYAFQFTAGSNPGATITTMGTGPNPLRLGSWSQAYSVGWRGNLRAQTVGIGSPGTFMPNFPGIKTVCLPIVQGGRTTSSASCSPTPNNVLGYIKFINRTSYTGSPGPGGGDYHLDPTSPGYALQHDYVLPYDITGAARYSADSAGAYGTGVAPPPGPGGVQILSAIQPSTILA